MGENGLFSEKIGHYKTFIGNAISGFWLCWHVYKVMLKQYASIMYCLTFDPMNGMPLANKGAFFLLWQLGDLLPLASVGKHQSELFHVADLQHNIYCQNNI